MKLSFFFFFFFFCDFFPFSVFFSSSRCFSFFPVLPPDVSWWSRHRSSCHGPALVTSFFRLKWFIFFSDYGDEFFSRHPPLQSCFPAPFQAFSTLRTSKMVLVFSLYRLSWGGSLFFLQFPQKVKKKKK